MKTLKIDLENCYGIRKLKKDFDFSRQRVFAIYAPNGAMKTSLARTFMDVKEGVSSKDRIFAGRQSVRKITDEVDTEISKEKVFVIRPYDEEFGHTEKTSTLLVDSTLRKEYEQLHAEIESSKKTFLQSLRELSKSKKDIEKEISSAFTRVDSEFYKALVRVKEEVLTQKDAPFSIILYDKIFNDKVVSFLNTKNFKTTIQEYIEKYNQLLEASTYFKKGIFNYYNAATIAKSLADNGFFKAKHTVTLNADAKTEISSQAELEKLIEDEQNIILNDVELKKKFAEIKKPIEKNADLREFCDYLLENREILPELANLEKFKEEIWKSYFKVKIDLFEELVSKYQDAEKRKNEIEKEAVKQRTQWEAVIEIFNRRFYVPFKLVPKNRTAVILGQEPLLNLGFIFEDGADTAPVEKAELLGVLSTGEKKALYVLNIIFEVEARKKSGQETIFVIDDIADSFDYKNKYAIIEYLQEISESQHFYQIILTHNFDFFRTIESRFINYANCLMSFKTSNGLILQQATGIHNVFVNDWKPNFFTDPKKKIASIPFIRNIIEYTKGDKDPNYLKLTSLLHWKRDTAEITHDDLYKIYKDVFGEADDITSDGTKKVVDILNSQINDCLNAGEGINFENKIVLSIAIRLDAEKFMIEKINDENFVSGIEKNQTGKLFSKFKKEFNSEIKAINIINRVMLMTPESIHLNSFMYEPILDMSDEHLRRLYADVKNINI
jgi:hypothetical protein